MRCAWIAMAGVVALVSTASAQQTTPKPGGTLNFAVTAEPPDYDCHTSQTFATYHTLAPIYSYLIKYDPGQDGKIVGDLAQSWTISPDGRTYTFKLHDNVTFHDGSPLTSADVKATFDRIANPPEGVVSLRKSNMVDIATIEAPDPSTVVFKLRATNVSMLDNIASPYNCVYSAAKLKQDPRFPEKTALGSGAFQVVEHVRGSHFTAKKFDGYFLKGRPYLDGYKAFFVKSNTVTQGMLGGQFDIEFRGRTPSERDQLVNAPNADRWVVHEGPWNTNNVIIFNTTKKPFDDPRVRRALSLAIDRWGGNESLSKITFVKATGGFLRPGYEYALPEEEVRKFPGYGTDIEKSRAEARRLLAEAGAENLTIKLHNRNLAEPYTPVGVFVIDQWRRVGVKVEHSQVETAPFFSTLVDGKFDVAFLPTSTAADDITAAYLYFTTNTKSPQSFARHDDTSLDALWDQQVSELDPSKRRTIVHQMERRMLEQNYYLVINWWQRIIVHHKRIKGWNFAPSHFQGQDLVNVWLDQ